jgi:hypothetical protein
MSIKANKDKYEKKIFVLITRYIILSIKSKVITYKDITI